MLFGMMALAVAAGAASAAPPSGAEIDNLKSLDIMVAGRVTERCQMGSVGGMAFGDLNRSGLGATARVSFECNLPFTFEIQAEHGGLAHERLPGGQGGYAGTVPYQIGVHIPVTRPHPLSISHNFTGQQLRSGARFTSQGGIATQGMEVDVRLGHHGSDAGLLAGNYGETIRITVTPNL